MKWISLSERLPPENEFVLVKGYKRSNEVKVFLEKKGTNTLVSIYCEGIFKRLELVSAFTPGHEELKKILWLDETPDDYELIISGLEEGSEAWKAEYDNCRSILKTLVDLKELKDKYGKTGLYNERQPLAWDAAKKFLENYQHESW